MMSIKILLKDLKTLSDESSESNTQFIQQLNDFLRVKKDDYYFYGYQPLDVPYLEITIKQLGEILRETYRINRKHPSLHEIINEVYQAGVTTNQTSVFLYGRCRS